MTDDEVAALRELHDDVHAARERVRNAAARRNAYMLQLLQQGETDQSLANALQLSRQRISMILGHKKDRKING